jgi:hypothetical protein
MGGSVLAESNIESFRSKGFSAILKNMPFQLEAGYSKVPDLPIGYKIAPQFPEQIEEYWRRVYVDVTTVKSFDQQTINRLSHWLLTHQPISLAINGDDSAYSLSRALFEKTALCVYTVGTPEAPALTAQARPQEGEVFGEFPPRQSLHRYTHFPVTVPSSTPSFNAQYDKKYLEDMGSREKNPQVFGKFQKKMEGIVDLLDSNLATGYARVLLEYLVDACGSKRGIGARTSLYGLQRPPVPTKATDGTVIRCEAGAEPSSLAIYLMIFHLTNARETLSHVSIHPDSKITQQAREKLEKIVPVIVEKQLEANVNRYNAIVLPNNIIGDLSLVGHLVATVMPLGHIKSTKKNDEEFVKAFEKSPKWLKMVE